MDDLGSFVESLVSQLGRAFFLAGFVPALVFVVINQYVLFGPDYGDASSGLNLFPAVGTPWLGLFSGEMLTSIVLSLMLGLILVVLNSAVIKMFEGLLPGSKLLLFPFYLRNLRHHRTHYAPIAARQQERRALLARFEETEEYDEAADMAIFDQLNQLHEEKEKSEPIQTLPYNQHRVRPTGFGNAWAVMEEYPLVRYGLDGMLFWPYIREIISVQNPNLLEEIDSQKLVIDVVVNLALTMILLFLEGLILGIVRFQWQMLALALIASLLFLAFYQASVGYARSLGSLVTKGYDLYRLPVLDAFGLVRPDDLDEEYWTWTRLSAFLRRGEPLYFEMLERSDPRRNS